MSHENLVGTCVKYFIVLFSVIMKSNKLVICEFVNYNFTFLTQLELR